MRILRGVGSRTLPCGCLAGFYETYDGPTVAIIDARGSTCGNSDHRIDAVINLDRTESDKLRQERSRVS